MVLFIIALVVASLSLAGVISVLKYSSKKFGDTFLGPVSAVILGVSVLIGLIMIPLIKTDSIDYREIVNYQVLKSPDAVIIDFTNSNAKIGSYNKLVKYNSYRAVTQFNDSTKIFEATERGFYKTNLYRYYTWSNPPYKFYNRE